MAKCECLLKISDKAEPFLTHVDMDTGRVFENYEWMESVYDVIGDEQLAKTAMPIKNHDVLYNVIFSIVNARMVIQQYENKLIVITDRNWFLSDYNGNLLEPAHPLKKDLIKVNVVEVGRALTPCFTFDIFHPASMLAIFKWEDQVYLMTRDGLKMVVDEIMMADNSVRITPAMILDSGVDAYGAYAIDGKIYYILKGR